MNYGVKITVLILLAVTFLLPFFSAQNFSPANDEITHLPSGYSYWKTGQITLNPQHPPFVKLIASFPLLFMDLKFDSQDPDLSGPFKNEWIFGKKFLVSNNADRLLFWGRFPVMLLSVLLGFYIYRWAFEMFSPKAGLLSLFLYAFMPNIIAHAQFVTTDLALASFSFAIFYYLWKFFKTNLNKHLIYSGLFLGLALSSKFSAVLFLPVVLFLIFVYAKSGRPVRGKTPFKERASADHAFQAGRTSNGIDLVISKFVKITAIMIAPAFLVVYFSYLMPSDSGFYLRGLNTIYADFNIYYGFYLNGQFSQDGWWYYFLEAFLIKTPISALIAFATALIFYKKLNINNRDKLFIFLPMIFFSVVTSLKAHDIGVRYLLPAFPFIILYAGALARMVKIRWGGVKSAIISSSIVVLGIWYVFSAVSIYPDYLAYFNEFVGGPANGYKYLDDSNLEWKHDLKRLAEYQKKHPDVKVVNSDKNIYFDLKYYGIKNVIPAIEKSFLDLSGRYAVNLNFLIRLKELSQMRLDEKFDWLSFYRPIDKVGYSFLIYEF